MKKEFDNIPSKINFGSEEFRIFFRNVLVNNYPNGNYYAIFYLASLIFIISIFAVLLKNPDFQELASIPIYFVFCNFFEYVFHRFPMHHKMIGLSFVYHHVTIHHNFYANNFYFYESPKDYYAVIIPYYVWIYIFISIVAISIAIDVILSYNQAMIFLITVFSYYTIYEILHFSYHAPESSWIKKMPFLRILSKFHLIHHDTRMMAKYNFNITFPIFDKIFGTFVMTVNVKNTGNLSSQSGVLQEKEP